MDSKDVDRGSLGASDVKSAQPPSAAKTEVHSGILFVNSDSWLSCINTTVVLYMMTCCRILHFLALLVKREMQQETQLLPRNHVSTVHCTGG